MYCTILSEPNMWNVCIEILIIAMKKKNDKFGMKS